MSRRRCGRCGAGSTTCRPSRRGHLPRGAGDGAREPVEQALDVGEPVRRRDRPRPAAAAEPRLAGARTACNWGARYTFTRTSAADRTETAELKDDQGAVRAELGTSVAIDGDTIVAGAPGKSVGTHAFQGAVLTFARTGDPARTQTAT